LKSISLAVVHLCLKKKEKMKAMKAFVLIKNGGAENLVLSELPVPDLEKHEVLIRSRAISINRVDPFVRQNDFAVGVFYKPVEGEEIVLGWDVSGVVAAVGSEVKHFKIGDEVFGLVNFFGRGRTNAEFVAAPADQLAMKPPKISHEEAAAAGLTALTAWDAIITYGQVQAGQKVLIHGAAGGVGHFAVQLAKHRGAYVIGTGSSGSKHFILGLGADEFIDYTSGPVDKFIADADVVVDPIPGDHVLQSLKVAKVGGRVISLLPYNDHDGQMAEIVREKRLFTHRVVVSSNGSTMKQIAELLNIGVLKPHVSQIFPFKKLPFAHLEIERGKTKGKIVVTVP
jgi:NADPH:quinone reductase-like Zn-dependent oxidoreductase